MAFFPGSREFAPCGGDEISGDGVPCSVRACGLGLEFVGLLKKGRPGSSTPGVDHVMADRDRAGITMTGSGVSILFRSPGDSPHRKRELGVVESSLGFVCARSRLLFAGITVTGRIGGSISRFSDELIQSR